jgi:hypothetical protein
VPIAEQLKQRSGNLLVEDFHKSLRPVSYSLSGLSAVAPFAVTVSWSWYDQSQGIVEWTFTNDGPYKESVILLRNGYYFGGAFAPVYLANSTPLCSSCSGTNGFGTSWIYTEPTQGGVCLVNGQIPPLMDYGSPELNAPPMAPVQFPNGQWLNFAFIFTLNPGQTWSMLEGGFSTLIPPYPQGVYQVTLGYSGPTCVGYDPQRVKDWDTQTGTNLQGYSPNPATFSIATVKAFGAPYDILPFNDPPIQLSACTQQPSPQPQPNPQPQPQPSPNPTQCINDILQAIADYQTNPAEATQLLVQGIICILDTLNVQPNIFLKSFLRVRGVTVEELLKVVGEYDAEKVKALVKSWFR